ncbi:MAG: acyl-CoA thioesterase [Chloroflexi bacterium]|nr:acyl-CoA thioesterase [Chloroflexota bacterium]
MTESLAPKRAYESYVEMTQLVLPPHANGLGTAFGGQIMSWIDICAGVAAMRHARQIVVTVSMDDLHFRQGIRIGEVVILKAQVNRAFNTSMEVGVRVQAENPLTGELRRSSSAYLTFVAIDEQGNRVKIPALIPETENQKRRYDEAAERRRIRLERRTIRRNVVHHRHGK